jgi:hypothetical protein
VRRGDDVRWIAANVDARESDLTRLSASNQQRWQALHAKSSSANNRAAAVNAAATSSVPPQSLGYTLLLIAAALLVLEVFMANHYLTVRREVPR